MNIRDFKLYMWTWPFLGGFLGLLLCMVINTDSAPAIIMLGMIGGYIALITYISGLKYLDSKGYDTNPDNEEK
ncbi:hypothetical protein [Ruminiclostridium papyrosolvens]|uniref:Uncharacterized protein n=1 Tax=Ruminiclostridium papyrosolvens C7 TaxID=1330534 RepID=U4R513_9FIRM|nr:hypothetical protein [Ruminiclostridium papyrosolvens]EPR13488.1 hypothetical protein L323_05765 [Ruminiclostridium papyrosolvens C7]